MHATGTMFLSKTRPEAGQVEGAFALTLLLFDRVGSRGVEAWRVRWTGPEAQAFWAAHQHDLVPGAALHVELEHPRSHMGSTYPPMPELRANVIRAQVCPKRSPTVREQLSTDHGAAQGARCY